MSVINNERDNSQMLDYCSEDITNKIPSTFSPNAKNVRKGHPGDGG
jgi:hypothetical protein